jgi:hypothetical protein
MKNNYKPMKRLCFLFIAVLFVNSAFSQREKKSVAGVNTTVTRLIEIISGPKGVERDEAAFRDLFSLNARLGWVGTKEDSTAFVHLTVDEFIKRSWRFYSEYGFKEKVYKNTINIYGNIAQVFQSYGTSINDKPERNRGINNIQLVYEGGKWKIVSIIWENESVGNRIPDKYLK